MGPGMMARLARGGLEVKGFDIALAARQSAQTGRAVRIEEV